MSVRLQLETGEVRDYRTWREVIGSYSEGVYETKYVTSCGAIWNEKPSSSAGCDHLGCAIVVAEEPIKLFKVVLSMAVSGTLIGLYFLWPEDLSIPSVVGMVFMGMMLLSGALAWIFISTFMLDWPGYEENKELIEFRSHGTINGVRAHQISGNANSQRSADTIRSR